MTLDRMLDILWSHRGAYGANRPTPCTRLAFSGADDTLGASGANLPTPQHQDGRLSRGLLLRWARRWWCDCRWWGSQENHGCHDAL